MECQEIEDSPYVDEDIGLPKVDGTLWDNISPRENRQIARG
jgi:hypothetical protein